MTTQRSRGRPRTFDRQAGLATATLLFWKHGYEGTSIADLTDALGITAPTLYAAFGSKEQLYRDVLAHYLERSAQAQQDATRDDVAAYALVEQYLRGAAARFTDRTRPAGCMISTAALNCAAENQGAGHAAAQMRAAMFGLLRAKLQQAVATGELPARTDPDAVARFYTAIVQGMSVQAIDGATADELNSFADIALTAWPGKRPEP